MKAARRSLVRGRLMLINELIFKINILDTLNLGAAHMIVDIMKQDIFENICRLIWSNINYTVRTNKNLCYSRLIFTKSIIHEKLARLNLITHMV